MKVFQDECWVKHPSGYSFGLLWLKKLAKTFPKGLERQRNIIWYFIYENKRKLEKRKVKGHKIA